MRLIGITGGIGMGKSTAAAFLHERGFPIVDTDQIARELVQPGEPALGEIVDTFGTGVIAGDGTLDREALAAHVFGDDDAKKRLEAILHPRIRHCWKSRAEQWRKTGEPLGFVVIPLLHETGAEKEFDKIVCVACPEAMQHSRLARRGWSESEIQGRIAAQLPTSGKIERADHLIWTAGPIGSTRLQLLRVLERFAE